jgi:signal transduction histidine kinase
MRGSIPRVRRLDAAVVDGVLAGTLVVAFAIETAVYADGEVMSIAFAALGCLSLAALAMRRSRPAVPAIVLCASVLLAAAAATDLFIKVDTPYIALMLALYSLGRYQRRAGVALGAAVVATMGVAGFVSESWDELAQVLWLAVLGAGPFAVGRVMRSRAGLQARLRESTLELERDRERRAVRAVEDERVRLAGELQAVIANGVSAMVVQAEAVPRLLTTGETGRAEQAFRLIEETGREALAEMRRLLGILRRDHDAAALAPQPTLRDVERLVGEVQAIGLEVELSVEGDRAPLSTGADLAVYRILEQALEAAAEGGAARATVTLTYEPDALRFAVSDDRPGRAVDQRILRSMRERIGLYGGSVRSEGNGEGTRVQASLPLREVAR